MLYRGANGVYRSSELDEFPWLNHGFGSRDAADWPGAQSVATLKQVHSDRVVSACAPGVLGEGDALVSARPGLFLAIRTADCIPILIVDPVERAVAAVHAGWRGTAARIAAAAVRHLELHCGSKAQDLVAVLGPGIAQCCFEVGPEVSERFGKQGRTRVDLFAINAAQLYDAGIPQAQVHSEAPCTACTASEFHSYRRDREASGRMVSGIAIRDK